MHKPSRSVWRAALLVVSVIAAPVAARETPPPESAVPLLDVSPDAADAVAVVERFGAALAAADYATVRSVLDADVLILESGGAERDRAQYLSHHAIDDAKALQGAQLRLVHRRARVEGALAWVASESEIRLHQRGEPRVVSSTETMVLQRSAEGWHIVHIHWSSRPKKNP